MGFSAPLRPPALAFAQEVPFDFLMFTRFLSLTSLRCSRRWVLRLGFFMASNRPYHRIQPPPVDAAAVGAAVVVSAST